MSDILSYANISSGYRFIKDGAEYNHYFPKADKKDNVIIIDGDVNDTVELMKKVVWRYIDDTKQIASVFRKSSVEKTCKAIWDFVYTYIQYKFDKQGLEQLRRPARSWADRNTGVDCDCMSIFISSVLTNLQIPHSFRITKYSKPSWQHVYVIVPHDTEIIAIDAVVSQFNYQKPYTAKKDYVMDLQGIDVAVLSGYDENDALSEALFGLDIIDDDALGLTDSEQINAIYRHLSATRNAVAQNPNLIVGVDDPHGFLKMLDYALKYWHTDKRQEALDILAQYEDKLNLKNGFSGSEEDFDGYDLDELGFIKPKKLFKKIGGAVKKAGKAVGKGVKAVGKGVVKGAKAVGKGAVKVAKTVGKGILKFNPLSIAARAGFLLTMKLNMKKMASKLKWGYATREQAARKGISASEWQRSVDAVKKVENLFVSKLQGKSSALKNAILKGKAGNLNGIIEYTEDYSDFEGLGIAPAAALAAAVPIVKVAIDIIKKAGLFKKGEDTNADTLSKELDSSANTEMRTIEAEDAQIRQIPAVATKAAKPPLKSPVPAKTYIQPKVPMVAAKAAKLPVKVMPAKTYTPVKAPAPAAYSVAAGQSLTPAYSASLPANRTQTQAQSQATSSGIAAFIKANPIPSLLIAGVLGLGIYKILAPKTKPKAGGLSGTGRTKRKPVKRTTAKRKTATKHRNVRKVKLF